MLLKIILALIAINIAYISAEVTETRGLRSRCIRGKISSRATVDDSVNVLGEAWIEPKATVGVNTDLHGVVDLEKGVKIGGYCQIYDSSFGARASVGDHSIVEGNTIVKSDAVIESNVYIGEWVLINEKATIKQGACVTSNVEIPAGTIVNSNEFVMKAPSSEDLFSIAQGMLNYGEFRDPELTESKPETFKNRRDFNKSMKTLLTGLYKTLYTNPEMDWDERFYSLYTFINNYLRQFFGSDEKYDEMLQKYKEFEKSNPTPKRNACSLEYRGKGAKPIETPKVPVELQDVHLLARKDNLLNTENLKLFHKILAAYFEWVRPKENRVNADDTYENKLKLIDSGELKLRIISPVSDEISEDSSSSSGASSVPTSDENDSSSTSNGSSLSASDESDSITKSDTSTTDDAAIEKAIPLLSEGLKAVLGSHFMDLFKAKQN